MSKDQQRSPDNLTLGIRHAGERRESQRRGAERGRDDRRRAERRRARWRSLLFTALAFTLPHQLRSTAITSGPRVSATIESFAALDPKRAYDSLIEEASKLHQVDVALIRSVVQAESGFDAGAVSRVGAMGLMQLMPDIAAAYGARNPFDPRENIMAGTRLLRDLLDLHRGNLSLVLASYNAGAGTVARYGGIVPPFKETQGYVKRVKSLIADARRSGN
jgi:soluble lytic murein transglycosylase-like protein